MKVVDLRQGGPDWHLWRAAGIGSSDAAVIWFGKHFETTVADLWRQKTTPQGRQARPENWAMAQGKRLEPEVRAWHQKVTGVKAEPVCGVHDDHPWMKASFDGWVPGLAVEIKYASRPRHEKALAGEVPEEYRPQLWHQCLVAGCKMAHYVSFNPRFEKGDQKWIVDYYPEEKDLEALLEKEQAFQRCVELRLPPG